MIDLVSLVGFGVGSGKRRGRSYRLHGGGEENVQHEECWGADPAFYQVPAVVFTSDFVASTTPVVVRQPDRPDDTERQHMIDFARVQAIESRPNRVVCMVERRQYRPHAINLAPIPVHFGDDEEDRKEREREGETGDDGVSGCVDFFQRARVADVGENVVWEAVELGHEGRDCEVVGGAVGERLDDWERGPGCWDDHDGGGGRLRMGGRK